MSNSKLNQEISNNKIEASKINLLDTGNKDFNKIQSSTKDLIKSLTVKSIVNSKQSSNKKPKNINNFISQSNESNDISNIKFLDKIDNLVDSKVKSPVNQSKLDNKSKLNDSVQVAVRKSEFLQKNSLLKKNLTLISLNVFNGKMGNIIKNDNKLTYLKNFTINDLQMKLNSNLLYLKILDIIIILLNLFIVTTLYFEHFEYIKLFKLDNKNNILRIVCLILSLIVIVCLVIREKILYEYNIFKYLLSFTEKLDFKINYKILAVEVFIHCVQPYPKLRYEWKSFILGAEINFNLNIILFLLSLLRLYKVLVLIKYWSFYSNEKSIRILKFYNTKFNHLFLFKALINSNSFISLLFIFISILYIFTLIFKVLENTSSSDKYGFSNFLNCMWYIFSTMTGTGYGDFYPFSLVGRFIGVLCCIIGIFVLGMVFTTLMILFHFNEDEGKVNLLLRFFQK